jgi:hypothetical protein
MAIGTLAAFGCVVMGTAPPAGGCSCSGLISGVLKSSCTAQGKLVAGGGRGEAKEITQEI